MYDYTSIKVRGLIEDTFNLPLLQRIRRSLCLPIHLTQVQRLRSEISCWMVFIRKCSFVVSLIFCFLSFYDLVVMAITKMIMSVAQSLRNFLMTVIAQVCVESTVQSVVSLFLENSKRPRWLWPISHARAIVLCFWGLQKLLKEDNCPCEGYCLVDNPQGLRVQSTIDNLLLLLYTQLHTSLKVKQNHRFVVPRLNET